MSRMPRSMMQHEVDVILPGALTGDGRLPGETRAGVAAGVHGGVFKVRDQRPKSDTSGEEVVAQAHIFLDPENYVAPGASIVIHKGTPAEHEGEVVRALLANRKDAPESAQAWIL